MSRLTTNNFIENQQHIQQEEINKQDIMLDDITHEITKLKDIAIIIGTEVDEHNALLDETNTEVGETNLRLNNTNKKLDKVMELAKNKQCWIITILLLILIIMIIVYFI